MNLRRTIAGLVVSGSVVLVAACSPAWYGKIEGEGPGFETIEIVEGRQFCKLLVIGNFDEWRPSGYPLHVVADYEGGPETTIVEETEDANASFEFRVVAGRHSSFGYSAEEQALLIPPGPMKVMVLEAHEEAEWSFKCRTASGDGGTQGDG